MWLCNRSRLNFLIFKEKLILFFISVGCKFLEAWGSLNSHQSGLLLVDAGKVPAQELQKFPGHIGAHPQAWCRKNYAPVAEFMGPWLRDKVNSGTGLSYRGPPAHVAWRAGMTTLYAGVDFTPQSGSMNSATGSCTQRWLWPQSST